MYVCKISKMSCFYFPFLYIIKIKFIRQFPIDGKNKVIICFIYKEQLV